MVLIILYESVECMKDVLEFGDSFIAKKLPPSNLNKKSSIKFQLKLTSNFFSDYSSVSSTTPSQWRLSHWQYLHTY